MHHENRRGYARGSPVNGGVQVILQEDGKFRCVLCGALVDVPDGKRPLVLIKARSGEPNMRAITLDGVELHACPFE
jgi:hypothetical protein